MHGFCELSEAPSRANIISPGGIDMTLKEIINKCDTLSIHEERCLNDEFCELVFYTKETDEWNRVFADILGPAIKPAGAKPTEDDQYLTKDYGGIWDHQTLFKKEFDGVTVIAMFWPWQDGIHTTAKMALTRKQN
jgi:hypothetical protein